MFVDREKLGKKGKRLEARRGVFRRLTKSQERHWAEDNGASLDTKGLGLLKFLDRLVKVEFKISFVCEFGNDKVVVRIEP